eukprot:gnl/TRDRNA2_/TRDRNA2_44195_c0_seq1.p1 gnl/TRDRNA2_/TRDRNA2_44195_c0~~gnl/TRDRNA2_/TRDRNA2_44195_c0_seq1.p1  ORF type:complete len:327 (+),score=72.88 gnl/TRDRNA2_/TRDRNA2_44195_c0_seq1:101-982(+)
MLAELLLGFASADSRQPLLAPPALMEAMRLCRGKLPVLCDEETRSLVERALQVFGSCSEAPPPSADEEEDLASAQRRADALTAKLSLLAARHEKLASENSSLTQRHALAVEEAHKLEERILHLRLCLRKAKALQDSAACDDSFEDDDVWMPSEAEISSNIEEAALMAMPGATAELESFRTELRRKLPTPPLTSEQDGDGDGFSDLEARRAKLMAYLRNCSTSVNDFSERLRLLSADNCKVNIDYMSILDSNRKLEHRIAHLRTCLSNERRRCNARKMPEGEPTERGLLMRGGC